MRNRTAFAALAASLAVLTGCGHDGDGFEDRAYAITAVYNQGHESRKTLEKVGIVVDEAACADAWSTSGAKDAERWMDGKDGKAGRGVDPAFQELRRLSFVNGCMDRPNKMPAVSITPTPSPSGTLR